MPILSYQNEQIKLIFICVIVHQALLEGLNGGGGGGVHMSVVGQNFITWSVVG